MANRDALHSTGIKIHIDSKTAAAPPSRSYYRETAQLFRDFGVPRSVKVPVFECTSQLLRWRNGIINAHLSGTLTQITAAS